MALTQSEANDITGGQKVNVRFTLEGSDKLEETIQKYIGRLKDIRPVGDALISHFRQIMQKQFDSSGSYLGKAWAPLMPSTIADKTRKGTIDNGILRDSMALYYSLTGGGPGAVELVAEDSVTFGSDIYYLGYLDLGTRKMTARPVYGDKTMFLHNMEQEYSRLIADHIMGRPVAASGELTNRSGGGDEGYLTHLVHEVREVIKRGREKGDEWAENWSSSSGTGGRMTGGGLSSLGGQ